MSSKADTISKFGLLTPAIALVPKIEGVSLEVFVGLRF